MHLLNPLQASKVILFIPFSHTLAPYCITQTFRKGNQICLRSLLPFRCIPFRAVATCIRSRSLHSIASSFHQPPQHQKQECFAPLPHSAYTNHSAKINPPFFLGIDPHIYPKNKKESKGKGLALVCKVKMHF
jgi:hypothetical protein